MTRRIAILASTMGVSSILGGWPALAAPSRAMRLLDTDKDGTVDLAEAKKSASTVFDKLDRDRDGTLDRRELDTFVFPAAVGQCLLHAAVAAVLHTGQLAADFLQLLLIGDRHEGIGFLVERAEIERSFEGSQHASAQSILALLAVVQEIGRRKEASHGLNAAGSFVDRIR